MDPFDESLDRRIWSLADTRLQWHKRIAENRRTVPTEIRDTLASLLAAHQDLDSTLGVGGGGASITLDDLLRMGEREVEAEMAEDGKQDEDVLDREDLGDTVRMNTAFAEELAQVRSFI